MDGATRNLLLQMSRQGGSVFAGLNVHLEDSDPVVERAMESGLIELRIDSWGNGDFYAMTRKGYLAIGEAPSAHTELFGSKDAVLILKIIAALVALRIAADIIVPLLQVAFPEVDFSWWYDTCTMPDCS